ncbi:HalOD1 output domain-containing protein [Haloarchaeobius sp. HRN-SO-5]|uniref:HalOD1 output domain-containing protein n=1 Tax=Haloarchaeobius sp. HRN-SO-5 TaxID=3446118 RepID=UPI003EBCB497
MNSHESPTYDPAADVYRARYRWSRDTPPSVAVVEIVSEVLGVGPLELDPLDSTVDADSLDALLTPPLTKDAPPLRVTFEYEGCRVVVSRTGLVEVEVETV